MTVTVTTDRTLFRTTVKNWLKAAMSLNEAHVIWANQSVPRPTKPYASVLFPSGSVKFGVADESEKSYNAGTQAVERQSNGPRTIVAQIEVYADPATVANADEAFELLENALLMLDTEGVRTAFRAAKLGVISQSPVSRMDEQLGDRWERRAIAEVVFSYSAETFDDGGGGTGDWIETVEIPSEQNGNADYGVTDEEYEGST